MRILNRSLCTRIESLEFQIPKLGKSEVSEFQASSFGFYFQHDAQLLLELGVQQHINKYV